MKRRRRMEGSILRQTEDYSNNGYVLWTRNSPGTFQTFMDHIFSNLKTKGWVVVYMDDISSSHDPRSTSGSNPRSL